MPKLIALLLILTPLASLAQEAAEPESGPSLRLYGFADFSYNKYLTAAGSPWAADNIFPANGAFSVGNLNLFIDGQLSPRARSLIEIRFTYLPNGALQTPNAAGGYSFGSTFIGLPPGDYTQPNATTSWGGIVVERAWVEYAFSDLFTLRAGQFLTPYGVWNVDHASVAQIDVFAPYIITQQLLPRSQVGLEGYGSHYFGETRAGWHLTLSNGRIESLTNPHQGGAPQYADFDHRFGFGGRAFVETHALGELKIGASFYTGRYTQQETGFNPDGPYQTILDQYDEVSAGADIKWEYKNLVFISELIRQQVDYTDAGRAAIKHPDFSALGFYALAGYRLPWHSLMPFAMFQSYSPDSTYDVANLIAFTAGVNLRLLPNLVFKASATRPIFPNAGEHHPYSDSLALLGAQIAWAF